MTGRLPIKRGTADRLGLRHRSTPRLVLTFPRAMSEAEVGRFKAEFEAARRHASAIAESEGGDPEEFARHLIKLRRATGGGP